MWPAWVLATLAVLLMICIAVVVVEVQNCKTSWAEDARQRKHRKLDGLNHRSSDQKIELIGARPDHERPAGVDWTISMWADVRGEYRKADRGYDGI